MLEIILITCLQDENICRLHYGLIGRCYSPTVVYFGKQVGFLQKRIQYVGCNILKIANYINEDNTVYNIATFLRLALKSTTYYSKAQNKWLHDGPAIVFSVLTSTVYTSMRYTKGVHLIVALRLCKAHYRTYPYFIHFNRLMCSLWTETQFLVLNPDSECRQVNILGIPCRHWTMTMPVALCGKYRRLERLFVSKVIGKNHRDSSLVNKTDCGAVPHHSFRFQVILNQFTLVGTCMAMNKAQAS